MANERKDRDKGFLFLVEIGGFNKAAFRTCSPIRRDTEIIENWEGGEMIADKDPGRTMFDPITLERAMTDNEELRQWCEDVVNFTEGNAGVPLNELKKTVDIIQLDRTRTPIRKYRLHECWPNTDQIGPWDNTTSENVLESVTLTFKYYTREPV